MSVISDSELSIFNKIPSELVLTGVLLCYLISGGRVSVSVALVVAFLLYKKHIASGESSGEANGTKKKGCCGGKGGKGCCGGSSVDENGVPVKKKGCCGGKNGGCHSKKAEDPAPAVEIAYDNEIDFTDSFKR